MIKSVIWFSFAALLTVFVGPLSLFASHAGRADPADLYIIVDGGGPTLSQHTLIAYGASNVGPQRGTLAKMIHAPPTSREQLMQAGYIMLPASTVAAICGISTASATPSRRS